MFIKPAFAQICYGIFFLIPFFCHAQATTESERNLTPTFHPKFSDIPIPKNIVFNGEKAVLDAPIGDSLFLSPILTVNINGQGPFFFMLDTGWSSAMISKRLVEKLNLPVVGKEHRLAETPTEVVDVFNQRYMLDKLSIGDVTLEGYTVEASSGFEDDMQIFKKIRGIGIDGVLGPSAFYGMLMTIDYKNESFILSKESLETTDKTVLPYAQNAPVPNINLNITFNKLNETVSQQFIVDTGDSSGYHINSCNIPQMANFTDKETLSSYDFTGNRHNTYFAKLFGEIDFYPGMKVASPYITFSKTNCNNTIQGLLGRLFFEQHLVKVDHQNQLVQILPYGQ